MDITINGNLNINGNRLDTAQKPTVYAALTANHQNPRPNAF